MTEVVIETLDQLVAHRDAFLADPGCGVDVMEIAAALDLDLDEDDEATAASLMFDHLVKRFADLTSIEVHRRMTVPDVGRYVDDILAGRATTGRHWSEDSKTECVMEETQADVTEVLLSGTVNADQVCWVQTFRQHLAWPLEREITFEGQVSLDTVRNMRTGVAHEIGGVMVLTVEPDEHAARPPIVPGPIELCPSPKP